MNLDVIPCWRDICQGLASEGQQHVDSTFGQGRTDPLCGLPQNLSHRHYFRAHCAPVSEGEVEFPDLLLSFLLIPVTLEWTLRKYCLCVRTVHRRDQAQELLFSSNKIFEDFIYDSFQQNYQRDKSKSQARRFRCSLSSHRMTSASSGLTCDITYTVNSRSSWTAKEEKSKKEKEIK